MNDTGDNLESTPNPEKSRKSLCSTGGSVFRNIFCPHMGKVGESELDLKSETRGLLAFRLMIVAGVFALSTGLYAIRSLLLPETEGVCLEQQSIAFVIFSALAVLLYRMPNLSLRTLRAFEVVLFGVMVLHMFRFFYLLTTVETEIPPSVVLYRAALTYFAIMVTYGMFIPNTWRRALAAVCVIGLMPAALTFLLWLADSETRSALSSALSLDLVSDTGLVLFLGAVVSSLSSHIIQNTRENAAKAREMGMYRLQERIGKGGMGEVWKAEHELLARPAAIKMIRPEVLTSSNGNGIKSIVPRFKREAQITANLRSPHTVELYDFGITQNGVFYYVMEFLDGLDLESLIDKFGPQPAGRVVYLLRQSTESLAEAHQNGLVHRDIKPSNLYISRMGVQADFLKVLDFGLVKSSDSFGSVENQLTIEGTTTGTPAFMAPEVGMGKSNIDARSDIYALGCVGYWLLTGSLVFEGETPMEVVVNHVKSEPIPPSRRTELAVPKKLDDTILACLAKSPDDRPQTVEQLSDMLGECIAELPWNQVQAAAWWDTHMPQLKAS